MTMLRFRRTLRASARAAAIGLPVLLVNGWYGEGPAQSLAQESAPAQDFRDPGGPPAFRDPGGAPATTGPVIPAGSQISRPVYVVPPAEAALSQPERQQIQSSLRTLGYYNGDIDGLFGGQTRTAIRAFQTASGVPVTGWLTTAQVVDLNQRAAQVAQVSQPAPPRRSGCSGPG